MSNNGHNIEKTNFDAFINAVGSEIQQAQVRLITADVVPLLENGQLYPLLSKLIWMGK